MCSQLLRVPVHTDFSFSRVEKKPSHRLCVISPTLPTKSKQEQPNCVPSPFRSYPHSHVLAPAPPPHDPPGPSLSALDVCPIREGANEDGPEAGAATCPMRHVQHWAGHCPRVNDVPYDGCGGCQSVPPSNRQHLRFQKAQYVLFSIRN